MRKRITLIAAVALPALILAGCGFGTGDDSTTTIEPTTTTSAPAPTTSSVPATTTTEPPPATTSTVPPPSGMAVYFLLDELDEDAGGPFLVPVYREGERTAEAALAALVAGPTEDEASGTPAISTAIPDGTSAPDVEIEDGMATVDFSTEFDDGGGSFSMFARLAQVVYTLTRSDDVDSVQFSIEGEPVEVFSSEGIELDGPQSRDDYYDLLPTIFVDTPAWGEPLTSPVRIAGLSNVFEAVSQVMLTDDDGMTLFDETVMATCGTGCWGEWETDAEYTIDRDQFGAVIVWSDSPRDGSRIDVREYPVQLR